ncbi:MAG: deoxyribose-phosphate aldolase [Bacteroidales bacterium]
MEKVLKQITGNLSEWDKPEVYSASIGLIDLTTLNSTDTPSKVESMIDKVNQFQIHYPKYPSVAAVCVYPNFAKVVKNKLNNAGVKIAVVAGAFPSSQSFSEIKVAECKTAVEQGANEVDIVLALNHFLDEDYKAAFEEIQQIKNSIGKAHLKVILETGALKTPKLIANASNLAIEAGADFIKTSTGKMEPAATPEAAYVMCRCIKEHYQKTGKKIGFKAAGGISTPEDAILYYAIVETILGKEWLSSGLFRFGASRLANNLLTKLEGKSVNYF